MLENRLGMKSGRVKIITRETNQNAVAIMQRKMVVHWSRIMEMGLESSGLIWDTSVWLKGKSTQMRTPRWWPTWVTREWRCQLLKGNSRGGMNL